MSYDSNSYIVILHVDPNISVKDDCIFSSDASAPCTKPTRYRLRVNNNGSVEGADPMTKAYFENPKKFNDRKADLARAKAIEAE